MEARYESNPLINRLPPHLKQYIKPRKTNYTSVNQAVWRYVMRKNVDYLSFDVLKHTVRDTSAFKYYKNTTAGDNEPRK